MEEKLLKALVDATIAFVLAHPKTAAVVAALWGIALLWKMQPKEQRDAWTKRSPRIVGSIRLFLELAPDLVGFVRVFVYQVVRGIAERASVASAPPRETQAPPPPDASAGFAELRVLGAIVGSLAVVALSVSLAGCPMPAADGCSPGARRCHEDTPQVCSPGQRWTPADVTCSTVNASCVVRDGVPACLRGEP